MNNSKFHRTMEEAFGPGNRGGIYTKPEPLQKNDKIVLVGSAIAALFVIAVMVFA